MSEKGKDTPTKLSVNLPVDVALNLEVLAEDMGSSKKEIVVQALRQFIGLKNREMLYRKEHPGAKLTAEITMKSYEGNETNDFAAMMLF